MNTRGDVCPRLRPPMGPFTFPTSVAESVVQTNRGTRMNDCSLPSAPAFDATLPRSAFLSLPADLERRIAARWKLWAPWVRMELLRRPDYEPAEAAAELSRLRKRHADQLLALVQAGVRMRMVRWHRLDDPRMPNDLHVILVRAAMARREKARLTRQAASHDTQYPTTQRATTGAYRAGPVEYFPVAGRRPCH